MLKVWITVGCAGALLAAVVIAFRLRNTRRVASPLTGQEPFGERLAVTVGRTGGMLTGAMLAGVLTVGAGGRLMMRMLAATSPASVQGLRTEADESIGKVTGGGSLFLIGVVGIGAALVGLAIFSVLRPWLPDRSLAAGMYGIAIGGGLLVRPTGLVSATNSDFRLIAPAALAVACCLATLAVFGATFGVMVDWFAARWPRPGWSPRGLVAVLPFSVLLLSPPMLGVVALSVVVGTVASGLRSERSQRPNGEPSSADHSPRVGRIAVAALGGLGGMSILIAAGQVLAL